MRLSRRQSIESGRSAFAGYRFPPEVIVLAVRWYLRFGAVLPRSQETTINEPGQVPGPAGQRRAPSLVPHEERGGRLLPLLPGRPSIK